MQRRRRTLELASVWCRYQPLRQLGAGGFGEVLLAQDRELGRVVAIKLLHPEVLDAETRARFSREARRTASVRHPGVIEVLDYSLEHEEHPFLVYEYVEGEDLRTRLDRRGPLPPAEVRPLGVALAAALQAVHRAGVTHRDVKPENVLLGADGRAVLCDFGICRGGGRATRTLTREGFLLGTPAYMAPELWQGGRPGPASDQYALATTLVELLLGSTPHGSHSLRVVLEAARAGRWPGVPGALRRLAPGLFPALRRALDSDPAARFADMTSFAEALEQAGDTTPRPLPITRRDLPSLPAASLPPTLARRRAPPPWWSLPALGAALLLATGGCLVPRAEAIPKLAPALPGDLPGAAQVQALHQAHGALMAAHGDDPGDLRSRRWARTAWRREHRAPRLERCQRRDYLRLWSDTAWALQEWTTALRAEEDEARLEGGASPFAHPAVRALFERVALRDLVHVLQDVVRLRVDADLAVLGNRDPGLLPELAARRLALEAASMLHGQQGGPRLLRDLQAWPEPVPTPVLILRLRLAAFLDQPSSAADSRRALAMLAEPDRPGTWGPWLIQSLLDNLASVASERILSLEERLHQLVALTRVPEARRPETAALILLECLRLLGLSDAPELRRRVLALHRSVLSDLGDATLEDPGLVLEVADAIKDVRKQVSARAALPLARLSELAALEAELLATLGSAA